jgi:hypothetical protein
MLCCTTIQAKSNRGIKMSDGSCLGRHDCWVTWEEQEAILNFSDELLQELGWEVDDTLEWEEQEDGSFILSKTNHE